MVDARVGLGWACYGQDRLEAAFEAFEIALRQRPGDASALDGLGSTFWKQGMVDMAVDALERASKADPELGGTLFKLGMIYEELGRLDDAYRAYQRVTTGTYAEDRLGEALARLEDRLGRAP